MRWATDETLKAFDLSRHVCREAAAECDKDKKQFARSVASAKTVTAVERMAKADRRHAATIDQWDADPWLLNTPDGVVDLKTGKIRPHRQADFITKMAAVGPSGDCPIWQEFLDRITDGDHDLQKFLQRMVGYGLTGVTREHALFFLHGTGANGKTVLTSTISNLMGDYHRVAAMETFVATHTSSHPTDLAGLRGARLVTAVETEEGRRWAESKIKALTGGDKISARFMRRDYFEFTPQFKLVVTSNHKPGLRNVDEAMKRRLHLVPFTVTIPEEGRDKLLTDKLMAEWPGILQWAIEGCLAWQKDGLSPPDAVRRATEAYLEAEDAISAWIAEYCTTGPNIISSTQQLFESWRQWAEGRKEWVGSQKRFSQKLEDRGFCRNRNSKKRGFLGISVK